MIDIQKNVIMSLIYIEHGLRYENKYAYKERYFLANGTDLIDMTRNLNINQITV